MDNLLVKATTRLPVHTYLLAMFNSQKSAPAGGSGAGSGPCIGAQLHPRLVRTKQVQFTTRYVVRLIKNPTEKVQLLSEVEALDAPIERCLQVRISRL